MVQSNTTYFPSEKHRWRFLKDSHDPNHLFLPPQEKQYGLQQNMKHGRFVNFYTPKSDPFFDSIQTSAKYYLARKRAFVSLFSRIFHAFNPQKHRIFGSKHSYYPLIAMLSPHKSSPFRMSKQPFCGVKGLL